MKSPFPLPTATLRLVICLVVSVQFFGALEGSMLLPLGPLLASRLRFPVEHVGYVNAAFLVSAAIAGLAGSLVLDRFDRRVALATALAGLAVGTAAAGFSEGLHGLIACRVLAGLCGGPAIALGLAVIGDVTPIEWRGRAMAAVSLGSSVALILGVPLALQMTQWFGWRINFFAIGGLGLLLAAGAAVFLPSGLAARSGGGNLMNALRDFAVMLKRRETLIALANSALIVSSINVLAINLAPYFVYNLGIPESDLTYLWAAGGAAGLVGGQTCGRLADRFGASKVLWGISLLAAALYFTMFVRSAPGVPLMVMMCLFLVCASGRIVLSNTMASLAPMPRHRGRFMSLMAATGQASAATAMIVGARVLETTATGALVHLDLLAAYAIAAALASAALGSWLARSIDAARRSPEIVAPPVPATP